MDGHGRGKQARRATPGDVRRVNRTLILQTLHRSDPMSRADLARTVGLTPAAVSAVVRALMADGLVEEVGWAVGRVGKPARLLAVDPEAVHIVALDLSKPDALVGGLVNLVGKLVQRQEVRLEGRTGEAAARAVEDLARSLIDAAERPLLGLGIGVPGIVAADGVVVNAAHLSWADLPLGDRLRAATGMPVRVANDADAAAFGELTFGQAPNDNLLLVRVDVGVGAGLVLHRQLFSGDGFATGEIGHTVVDPDGDMCACGKRGCLETLVSAPLLERRLHDAAPLERTAVVALAGRHLGLALAMVLSAVNLHEVVLSGSDDVAGETFRAAATSAIAERTMPSIADRVRIRPSSFGVDDVVVGAAGLVANQELGLT
jgi:predicted NBD/HSP70 family sugar kinase